jgi:hypothetical protein
VIRSLYQEALRNIATVTFAHPRHQNTGIALLPCHFGDPVAQRLEEVIGYIMNLASVSSIFKATQNDRS